MPYLQDKNNMFNRPRNPNKNIWIAGGVFLIIVFFLARGPIFRALSWTSSSLSAPVMHQEAAVGNSGFLTLLFGSKESLLTENTALKAENETLKEKQIVSDALTLENTQLKALLSRSVSKSVILGAVLQKPNRSLYDTLIVDVGSNAGVVVGKKVFTEGDILIGEVAEVDPLSSKIKLYSTPGEKLQVEIGDKKIVGEAEGLGAGNFALTLPRDIVVPKGSLVVVPGLSITPIATVEDTLSDPRDPFQKVLMKSPVNIFELHFIEIEK